MNHLLRALFETMYLLLLNVNLCKNSKLLIFFHHRKKKQGIWPEFGIKFQIFNNWRLADIALIFLKKIGLKSDEIFDYRSIPL